MTNKNQSREVWKNDEEFNQLLAERKNYTNKSLEYKSITKRIKKRINHLRNLKLREEANKINDNANQREIEELYRNMKNGNTSFLNSPEKQQCQPKKLKEYFKIHFNTNLENNAPLELNDAQAFLRQLQNTNVNELDTDPPNLEELTMTIKSLKNGKSAYDVPAAYIKHAMLSKAFSNEMVKLFDAIWKNDEIPQSWGHSKLVTLWKGPSKGSQKDPASYRALQIGSTLCKILVTLIIKRIKDWYESQLMDQQQGFRSGRGTTDGIYILKRIHQITDKMKRPTNVLFIDLASAFDHVDRKLMFQTIYCRLSPTSDRKLFYLFETLYSYTTTALKETPDNHFELTNGVRQGGPESPILFNLFMDFVMRIYLEKCKTKGIKFLRLNFRIPRSATHSGRTKVGKETSDWVGYADDLALTFEDTSNLQLGLSLLFETFKKYHLEINISKTKTMILNHQYTDEEYPDTISKFKQPTNRECQKIQVSRMQHQI